MYIYTHIYFPSVERIFLQPLHAIGHNFYTDCNPSINFGKFLPRCANVLIICKRFVKLYIYPRKIFPESYLVSQPARPLTFAPPFWILYDERIKFSSGTSVSIFLSRDTSHGEKTWKKKTFHSETQTSCRFDHLEKSDHPPSVCVLQTGVCISKCPNAPHPP